MITSAAMIVARPTHGVNWLSVARAPSPAAFDLDFDLGLGL